jgi:hypothetical protein
MNTTNTTSFPDIYFVTECSFCKNKFNQKKDKYIIIYQHIGFKTKQFKFCDKCTRKFMKTNKKWVCRNEKEKKHDTK